MLSEYKRILKVGNVKEDVAKLLHDYFKSNGFLDKKIGKNDNKVEDEFTGKLF